MSVTKAWQYLPGIFEHLPDTIGASEADQSESDYQPSSQTSACPHERKKQANAKPGEREYACTGATPYPPYDQPKTRHQKAHGLIDRCSRAVTKPIMPEPIMRLERWIKRAEDGPAIGGGLRRTAVRASGRLVTYLAATLVALDQDCRRGAAVWACGGFVAHLTSALVALD